MKFILPLLFLPFIAAAQRDFDYSLFTGHAHDVSYLKKDGSFEVLSFQRRFVKEGSRLTIVHLINTGNSREYHIEYVGFRQLEARDSIDLFGWGYKDLVFLEYATEDRKIRFSINPMIPLVELHEIPSGKLISRYY